MSKPSQSNGSALSTPDLLPKEKDPREILGMESQSSLLISMCMAILIGVGLLAVLTIGPYAIEKYAYGENAGAKKEEVKKEEQEQPKKEEPKAIADKDKAPKKEPTTPVAAKDKPPVTKDALDKLGIGETKTGTPPVNPLEDKGDDLLKELDK